MTAQNPFGNMADMFKNMPKMPQIDKETMMKSHKKNLDALNEANKMAVEVMKSITQLQSQYMKQAFEDFATMMKDFMGKANAKDAMKESVEKHSHHVKNHVTRAMEHGANITNTLAKTQKEIFEIMHNRYNEGINELNEIHNKSKTKH